MARNEFTGFVPKLFGVFFITNGDFQNKKIIPKNTNEIVVSTNAFGHSKISRQSILSAAHGDKYPKKRFTRICRLTVVTVII